MKGNWMEVNTPNLSQKYHVIWGWSNSIVGRVVAIDWENKTVTMRSPKSKKNWKNPVKFSDLRHIRKHETKEKELQAKRLKDKES